MSILIDLTKKIQGKPTDKVDADTRKQRVLLCNACPKLNMGLFCGECGCFVSDKVGYAADFCPDGKWSAKI